MMMDIEVALQHLIEIKRLDPATDRHSHGVAQEVDSMLVFQEARVLGKQRAFFWFFDVAFQRDQPFAARLIEQLKRHLQQIDVAL